jgi:DNA-binding transcriptional LysR family regulator
MPHKPPPLRRPLSDVDIRLLRLFKTVVECGGFSAAEVELDISRAAISQHMADLEQRVGLRLCQRGRAGFSLTDEGRQIHAASLKLLAALEDFRTEVNSVHARLRGELNIGITDNLVTMPRMRITDALRSLKDAGPDVRINIRMIPPNEIELGVLDGHLHVGVVPEVRPLAGLDYRPLYDEESRLYCGIGHSLFALRAAEIEPEAVAAADAVAPAYAQTPEIRSLHQRLNPSATASDREGVAFLILTGRYIGYLPTHYARQWVEQSRMRALPWPPYTTELYVITRKGSRPNLVLDTFLGLLFGRGAEQSQAGEAHSTRP